MERPAAAAAAVPKHTGRPEDDAPTKAKKTRIFKAFSRQGQDLFGCHFKQIDAFYREACMWVAWYALGDARMLTVMQISRKEGPMGGSSLVTEVNNVALPKPLLIYGTPKLAYPYKKDSTEYKDLSPAAKTYILANKWNGMNILFYKYSDAAGREYVTAKSKGAPFISDTPFGAFFTNTLKALGNPRLPLSLTSLPAVLSQMAKPEVQAKSCELCGKLEPHLVAYDFDIALKPLFVSYKDGSIQPAAENKEDLGPFPFDNLKCREQCISEQTKMHAENEAYRKAKGLEHKYEHNHFLLEGRVLYLLDARGFLLDRTMYKVKPPDIEEVHWANFDATMQGRVREAVEKIFQREKPLNAETLQEELDMGPKEWGRFGRDVMKYATELNSAAVPSFSTDKRRLVVVMGLPGSGTQAFAKALKARGWTYVNEDYDHSSNEELKERLVSAFKSPDAKVVVERVNATYKARSLWTDTAKQLGLLHVELVQLDIPKETCVARMQKQNEKFNLAAFEELATALRPAGRKEGFTAVHVARNEEEINALLVSLCTPAP